MIEFAGPLSEIAEQARRLWAEHLPRDLQAPMLALMLALAGGIWWLRDGRGARDANGRVRQSGLAAFLLPRDIYTHPSARVDVLLYVFERLLRPLWVGGALLTVGPAVEQGTMALLGASFGASPHLQPNLAWMLLYSFVGLLAYDFVFYLTHLAEHRIPALWAIHQVHHSAEVLTPLTRYREHVLEGPLYGAGAAVALGFAGGLFGWLHSPVMHHVHHSYLPRHRDRNLAAVTSLWDRLFGTLYVPAKDEDTPWGLGPETQPHCSTFRQTLVAPFRGWWRMLRRLRSLPLRGT